MDPDRGPALCDPEPLPSGWEGSEARQGRLAAGDGPRMQGAQWAWSETWVPGLWMARLVTLLDRGWRPLPGEPDLVPGPAPCPLPLPQPLPALLPAHSHPPQMRTLAPKMLEARVSRITPFNAELSSGSAAGPWEGFLSVFTLLWKRDKP